MKFAWNWTGILGKLDPEQVYQVRDAANILNKLCHKYLGALQVGIQSI